MIEMQLGYRLPLTAEAAAEDDVPETAGLVLVNDRFEIVYLRIADAFNDVLSF